MIKPILKDPIFLSQKSQKATLADLHVAQDLLETISAHREECIGMAANMIGSLKCIIIFELEDSYMTMYNPEIIRRKEPYYTDEGCLSLPGMRKCRRWNYIKVQYQNKDFDVRIKSFTGIAAEIIQHEIDHCNGILI